MRAGWRTLRRPVFAGLAAAALLAAGVWLWAPADDGLQRLTPAQIAALDDSAGDRHRLLVHLTAGLVSSGRLAPSRTLPAPARHVCDTLTMEALLDALDVVTVRRAQSPAAATFREVGDGYAALGCAAMAELLFEADQVLADPDVAPPRGWDAGFTTRYRTLLPAARLARLDFQRRNAAEL